MVAVGADVIVAHMGLTSKGSIGAKITTSLEDATKNAQDIKDAAKNVRGDVIVLCHGGPISSPDDAQFVLSMTNNVAGFFGASGIERLPVETAITEQVSRFKSVRLGIPIEATELEQ